MQPGDVVFILDFSLVMLNLSARDKHVRLSQVDAQELAFQADYLNCTRIACMLDINKNPGFVELHTRDFHQRYAR
jgi:ubiquinone/menaquinone biosynthesis C-methylase UbiE